MSRLWEMAGTCSTTMMKVMVPREMGRPCSTGWIMSSLNKTLTLRNSMTAALRAISTSASNGRLCPTWSHSSTTTRMDSTRTPESSRSTGKPQPIRIQSLPGHCHRPRSLSLTVSSSFWEERWNPSSKQEPSKSIFPMR
uniref:Uncharacterized protein n=1 Tax=Cacopsylla melanoneura TaxID=428564 RepID=A0A8D9B901_9HEMI